LIEHPTGPTFPAAEDVSRQATQDIKSVRFARTVHVVTLAPPAGHCKGQPCMLRVLDVPYS
jgi:hypothetical protein